VALDIISRMGFSSPATWQWVIWCKIRKRRRQREWKLKFTQNPKDGFNEKWCEQKAGIGQIIFKYSPNSVAYRPIYFCVQ